MGHHSKKSKLKIPDNSKEIKKLQKVIGQIQRELLEYQRKQSELVYAAQDMEQNLLNVRQSELSQMSSSANSAQKVRGLAPDFEIGSPQDTYQRARRRDELRRDIGHIQASVNEYLRRARRAQDKASQKESELAQLMARLAYLQQNPTFDLKNWGPVGRPGSPDDDGSAPFGYGVEGSGAVNFRGGY